MHHYGEAGVRVAVSEWGFMIELRNHVSDATITVTGPIQGIFEDQSRPIDEESAMYLGRELAHAMRQITGE